MRQESLRRDCGTQREKTADFQKNRRGRLNKPRRMLTSTRVFRNFWMRAMDRREWPARRPASAHQLQAGTRLSHVDGYVLGARAERDPPALMRAGDCRRRPFSPEPELRHSGIAAPFQFRPACFASP